MPADCAARCSAAVQNRLLDSAYADAPTLVLYAAQDHEIHTGLIFARALAAGRRVLFPRVPHASRELLLVRVNGPAELAPGAFGLLEPTGAEIVPVADLGRALICVPGVAFAPGGQRLGRGGGYYDRLLARTGPQVTSAGLAYAFQLLDQLPESPGDQRLNLILTESTAYVTAPRAWSAPRWTDQGGVSRC